MKTYQLQITINENGKELQKELVLLATDSNELAEKLNALQILNQSVAHDDLISTVDLFHEKPELVPLIKNMIEEGEELSESQLLLRVPKYVKQILRVLKS
jgi:late competence protein required for DNA uptake (superfamily II DNA/RNA helicase)